MSMSPSTVAPTGWHESALGEVCELISRGIAPSYVDDGGVPVLNQKCIRAHEVDFSLARRTDPSIKRVPPERFVKAGDVLVNSTGTGTLGRVAQVRTTPEEAATVDTHVTIVRPVSGLFDIDFFGYALIAIEDQLIAGGQGAVGQTELPRADIAEKFRVRFPDSLDEQRRIVAVLDQTFAALERARANAEANLADAQLVFEQTLLTTFDELLPSVTMKSLAEAATDFSRGKSRHRPRNDPALYEGEYPFIQTGDVRRAQGAIREFSQTYNEFGLAQSKLWPVGTVCITIAANIAETGVLEMEACFPDSVIGMVPSPGEATPYYVEYMLRYFSKELKLRSKGSAQDNINLTTFEDSMFPFPSVAQQNAIVEKLDALAAAVSTLRDNYTRALEEIAALRQSLLQTAFSGQLT